jgi:hypothetical protein
MGLANLFIRPFEKYFRPPILDTPISTIRLPAPGLTVTVCVVSFFIITSGFVFCFVNGMPMTGYYRDENGHPTMTWIAKNGLSSQYLAEGLIASGTYSLGALSLIAAFYEMNKNAAEMTEIDRFFVGFAYTAPIWAYAGFNVFHMKIPSYFPKFSSR